jgi:hypothetical protein
MSLDVPASAFRQRPVKRANSVDVDHYRVTFASVASGTDNVDIARRRQ